MKTIIFKDYKSKINSEQQNNLTMCKIVGSFAYMKIIYCLCFMNITSDFSTNGKDFKVFFVNKNNQSINKITHIFFNNLYQILKQVDENSGITIPYK